MTKFSHITKDMGFALIGLTLYVWPSLALAQANVIVAEADMRNMAEAMEVVALDTTRYVSLENLNDLSATNTTKPFDSIKDQGGVFSIIPQDGFFLPRKDLTLGPNPWRGPYVTFQQGRTQAGTTPYDQGSPLDPWGTPYYLFNPFGLIRGDEGIITLELYGDQFDRYTIVSLGPDGIMGTDDISREFGAGVTSTRLTSLRGDGVLLTSAPKASPIYDVQAGTTVTLRGYNFGAARPDKSVLFGTTVLEDIVSWTSREVTVVLPETLGGTGDFAVYLGLGTTNVIHATIIGTNTSVDNWSSYGPSFALFEFQ